MRKKRQMIKKIRKPLYLTLTAAMRNQLCDSFVNQIDNDSGSDGGAIIFHDSNHVEVATCRFSGPPAFSDARTVSTGVARASANEPTDDASATGGTIDHAHLVDRADTPIAELTVGVGSGDFQGNTLVIDPSETVTVDANASVEMPAT